MPFSSIREIVRAQLASKELYEQARTYAFDYIDNLEKSRVYPDESAIAALESFDEPLPEGPSDPALMLEKLHTIGSKATAAQSGGRYFGFVNGSHFPVAIAARWMADVWDQNSALYVMSPIVSKLEEVCEKWIIDVLGLPPYTSAGFVSGSSTAILCALAAARNELLKKQNWDVHRDGLFGAPPIRVVLGQQAHSSVVKALSLLGIGKSQMIQAPVDAMGRIIPSLLPPVDAHTLLIAQAGNVNGGAFDPMEELSVLARKAGAWLHVDGAFGLWAAASMQKCTLIAGFENADSWSADAHKTLNVPYDCGIVLCKDRTALTQALQATGSYLQYSEHRDGMLYTSDMSRRARSVELWATLKFLGKAGVGELVDTLCDSAAYFAQRLLDNGFEVVNEVVFNQVLVRCETPEVTRKTLKNIQDGGILWCGDATWQDQPVIRISVCSYKTGREDVEVCVAAYGKAREEARQNG